MRKPAFFICESKGADQLHSNLAVDQCLYFRYIKSTITESHLLWLLSPVFVSLVGNLEDRFSHDTAQL